MSNVKHTTISVNKEVYAKFKEYCNQNGYGISKLIEIIMLEKMSEESNKQ